MVRKILRSNWFLAAGFLVWAGFVVAAASLVYGQDPPPDGLPPSAFETPASWKDGYVPEPRPRRLPLPAEAPPHFGQCTRLADMPPGTWYWSEGQQTVFLTLAGGEFCNPRTGEHWAYADSAIGWPCLTRLETIRPNGIDIRPWSDPRGGQLDGNAE
jgi:hypothetical protein